MKALGRVINVVGFASSIHIDLANASGVTFVCYENGGAQQITIKESKAGASATLLAVVTEIFASDGVGSVHTKETTDANGALGTGDSDIVKKDTTPFDTAVFYIGADELSDTFDSVQVAVDAGTVMAIVHDLLVQRAPENLPVSGVV